MSEVIKVQDRYYILASTSMADAHEHTLKHGDLFAIFDGHGDIRPLGFENQGLFYQGTRFLSRLRTTVNGLTPLLLSSNVRESNDVVTVDLTNPDYDDPVSKFVARGTIHFVKSICVWEHSYIKKIEITNYGLKPVRFTLKVDFDSDYHDIFEVRGMKREKRGERIPTEQAKDCVIQGYRGLDGVLRRTQICFRPNPVRMDSEWAEIDLELNAGEKSIVEIKITCSTGDELFNPPDAEDASQKSRGYYEGLTKKCALITTGSDQFNAWIDQSYADLFMLITKTEDGLYPFAGIPWYSTYFGRDGIITAFETLWLIPDLARGVLEHLSRTQADKSIETADAEPGKIIHEERSGEMAALGEVPFGHYYGSVDAVPLFVMLAGAYYERTDDFAFLKRLWPHVEAAIAWMDKSKDPGDNGFLNYYRTSAKGLLNQGWKDSNDSVFHTNGELAIAPIALCEVQGYLYSARVYAASMAKALGERALSQHLHREAVALRRHFQEKFWDEETGMYALALDAHRNPCRVRSSNAGHTLFTGIASRRHAELIKNQLMGERFFTGWGLRTIAAGEARYNPMSYHNGSVWPHDNAMIAYGLAKYGHKEAASKIMSAVFEANLFFEWHRLPELFCGFERRLGEGPTLYPVACSPQAWAAGSVFMFLQACLGLHINAPENWISFESPSLPPFLSNIIISNLRVNSSVVDVILERHTHDVSVTVKRKVGRIKVITTK